MTNHCHLAQSTECHTPFPPGAAVQERPLTPWTSWLWHMHPAWPGPSADPILTQHLSPQLAEGKLNALLQTIHEGVRQDWSQHGSQGDPIPTTLGLALSQFPSQPRMALAKLGAAASPGAAMGEGLKSCAEFQGDKSTAFSSPTKRATWPWKSRWARQDLPLLKPD